MDWDVDERKVSHPMFTRHFLQAFGDTLIKVLAGRDVATLTGCHCQKLQADVIIPQHIDLIPRVSEGYACYSTPYAE